MANILVTVPVFSSSPDGSYRISAIDSEGGVYWKCSCPAGRRRYLCKHVISLLAGDKSILYDEQDLNAWERGQDISKLSGVQEIAYKLIEKEHELAEIIHQMEEMNNIKRKNKSQKETIQKLYKVYYYIKDNISMLKDDLRIAALAGMRALEELQRRDTARKAFDAESVIMDEDTEPDNKEKTLKQLLEELDIDDLEVIATDFDGIDLSNEWNKKELIEEILSQNEESVREAYQEYSERIREIEREYAKEGADQEREYQEWRERNRGINHNPLGDIWSRQMD